MDYILKIVLCLVLIGIYWIPIVDSQCDEVPYLYHKCQVCEFDKNCPRCKVADRFTECRHDNRCRCTKGYGKTSAKGCVKADEIVEYGGDCDVFKNTFCNDDDMTSCANGKCVCINGYDRDQELGQCISGQGLLLDFCKAQPDTCSMSLPLKCDESTNRCHVKKGYKYNCLTAEYEKGKGEYKDTCDEAACSTVQPGCKPCNPDKYLECQNGVCVCMEGYFWDPNTRVCVVGSQQPGQNCSPTKLCDPEQHLICVDGFCVCKYGYQVHPSNNSCVEMKYYDEDCSVIQCHPVDPIIICGDKTKKCDCKDEYEYSPILRKCVPQPEYNEKCDRFTCNPFHNLECKTNIYCDCKQGYKYDPDENRCLSIKFLTWWQTLLIIFGAFLILALIIACALWCFRRRRRRLAAEKKRKELLKRKRISSKRAMMKRQRLINSKASLKPGSINSKASLKKPGSINSKQSLEPKGSVGITLIGPKKFGGPKKSGGVNAKKKLAENENPIRVSNFSQLWKK